MDRIVSTVYLDVYDHDVSSSTIKTIALDSQTRYVRAYLQKSGEIYNPPTNTVVTLTAIRPDKVGAEVSGRVVLLEEAVYGEATEIEETLGGETTSNAEVISPAVYGLEAEITQAMIAVPGTVLFQFKMEVDGEVLRTEIFRSNNGRALDGEATSWASEYQGYNLDELAEKVEFAVRALDDESQGDTTQALLSTHLYVDRKFSVRDNAIHINDPNYEPFAGEKWVEPYFANMIAKKTEDWLNEHPDATTTVEDGSINASKLTDDLRTKMASFYDSVSDLIEDVDLIDGAVAITLGYYSKNDGGGAVYKITGDSNNIDNVLCVSCRNGLTAVLQTGNNCNALQFGCDNTGTRDCSAIINAISEYIIKNYPVEFINGDRGCGGGVVFFPKGTYLISERLVAVKYIKYIGDYHNTVFMQGETGIACFKYDPDNTGTYDGGMGKGWDITLENIIFKNFSVGCDFINSKHLTIKNCKFLGGNTGISIRLGVDVLIENVMCYGCAINGIKIQSVGTGPLTTVTINKCWIAHNVNGLSIQFPSNAVSGLNVVDTIFEYNNYALLPNFASDPAYVNFMNFVGCYFEGNTTITTFTGKYTCNMTGCFFDATDTGILFSGTGTGKISGNTPEKTTLSTANLRRFDVDSGTITTSRVFRIMRFKNRSSLNINDYLPSDTKVLEITYTSDEYTSKAFAKVTKDDNKMYVSEMVNQLTDKIIYNNQGVISAQTAGTNAILEIKY